MSKGLESLENIKIDMEYVTRLDFVEPIVRGEVQQSLYKIYHRETPELETIEKELKAFEIISEKNVAITMIKQTQSVREYNAFAYDFLQIKRVDEEKYKLSPQPLTPEEYESVKRGML